MTNCTPVPDALNPCEDLMGYPILRVAVWFVAAAAVLGNLSVIIVHLGVFRRLSVPRFLQLNLAIGDFVMGIYLSMLALADLTTVGSYFNFAIDWQQGFGCKLAGSASVFSSQLSIFTLSLITFERYFTITYSMDLNMRLKLGWAAKIMCIGWIFALVAAILPIFGDVSSYSLTSVCLPIRTDSHLDRVYIITLLIIDSGAFLMIFACYLRMYLLIRSQKTEATAKERTVAMRMALLVFTDFACWAPIIFFVGTALFWKPLISVTDSKILVVFFYPLNSLANPFLYVISTRQYKRDFNYLSNRLCLWARGICNKKSDDYLSFNHSNITPLNPYGTSQYPHQHYQMVNGNIQLATSGFSNQCLDGIRCGHNRLINQRMLPDFDETSPMGHLRPCEQRFVCVARSHRGHITYRNKLVSNDLQDQSTNTFDSSDCEIRISPRTDFRRSVTNGMTPTGARLQIIENSDTTTDTYGGQKLFVIDKTSKSNRFSDKTVRIFTNTQASFRCNSCCCYSRTTRHRTNKKKSEVLPPATTSTDCIEPRPRENEKLDANTSSKNKSRPRDLEPSMIDILGNLSANELNSFTSSDPLKVAEESIEDSSSQQNVCYHHHIVKHSHNKRRCHHRHQHRQHHHHHHHHHHRHHHRRAPQRSLCLYRYRTSVVSSANVNERSFSKPEVLLTTPEMSSGSDPQDKSRLKFGDSHHSRHFNQCSCCHRCDPGRRIRPHRHRSPICVGSHVDIYRRSDSGNSDGREHIKATNDDPDAKRRSSMFIEASRAKEAVPPRPKSASLLPGPGLRTHSPSVMRDSQSKTDEMIFTENKPKKRVFLVETHHSR